jgi:predicted phosphodiesterase
MRKLDEVKSGIVKEYLTKYPTKPTMTIAKAIWADKENRLLWTNLESVRSYIRIRRGKLGGLLRKQIKDKEFFNQKPEMPKSLIEDFTSYYFPTACDNILLISDVHVPFHNEVALQLAIDYGIKENVNTIFFNGDILDNFSVSSYLKKQGITTHREEFDKVRQFLDYMRYKFPKAKFIWKDGNHEERYIKYLMLKAPELYGDDEYRIDVKLDFYNRGIEYITDKRPVYIGGLMVLHGHELMGTGGVNPAKTAVDKLGINIIVGDKHRTQTFVKPRGDGSVVCGWSVGHLGEANPEYMRLNNWNYGFAHIQTKKELFTVKNFMIDVKTKSIY